MTGFASATSPTNHSTDRARVKALLGSTSCITCRATRASLGVPCTNGSAHWIASIPVSDILEDFSMNRPTFKEIVHQVWEKFGHHIKGQPVKHDVAYFISWQTVQLLDFEYGLAITKAKALDTFLTACIRPQETDRAGATAECSLRDVGAELEAHWGHSFQATVVTSPPVHIVQRLRASASQVEQRLSMLARSAHMVLDRVNGALADFEELHQDWTAFVQRMEVHKTNLQSRKLFIKVVLEDFPLVPMVAVIDPLSQVENLDDFENAE
ncbi:hypothetical protein ON010_g16203 [Phytophthora cinnamomi]|nr:hypothetical protein ON010_g16203 [Phytophthora cinnamomi]